ncbi:MAG TPA: HigA family addiction module antitoxin [Chthonomonadaceae bacterium]|nr:HigA family addiction module antitoxin [Chthonomonadaceae bacterium]
MARLSNIHPGEVLLEEFLIPLGITQYALARKIGVDQGRISEIIKGRRRLTPETALRLAAFFGTTPRFWLNLQDEYDLEEARNRLRTQLEQIEPYRVMKASA